MANDVLSAIVDQAQARPDQPAVRDLDHDFTYSQLLDEAANVASGLVARGVTEGDRVALLVPNSANFVVAALACMWIGAIFVPLAVTDPEARLASIVTDCAAAVVITTESSDEESRGWAALGGAPIAMLATLRGVGEERAVRLGATDRAVYAIYTSGTTGTPKGVLIGSKAFAAAVESTAKAIGITSETRTLCVSPFHFDGSFAGLFPTLIAGGAAVIRPRESLLFPRIFFNTVAAESITYSCFSPSYLRLLVASPQLNSLATSSLKVIALGGEACSVADLAAVWSAAPGLRIFNRYGPTETTIAVTNFEVTPAVLATGTIPLGYPHPGVAFYLIDDDGQIIEGFGTVGELVIAGNQLMTRYWGAPDLTSEVLRDDVVPGLLTYRTGDLLYRDDEGRYVYVGRADRVIKRSGVRISLLEMSEAIRGVSEVQSVVCALFDSDNELGIVAFVVCDAPLTSLDLLDDVRLVLPETMLPDRVCLVDNLPMTRSGKVDELLLLSRAGLRPMRDSSRADLRANQP